jgi:cytochrome c peroxidase
MVSKLFARPSAIVLVSAVAVGVAWNLRADGGDDNLIAFEDVTGQVRTFSANGAIDLENPFFQDLGANGRSCVTCHQPSTAWSITPENVQSRFMRSRGRDPIFTNNDGSNCEGVSPRSLAETRAYSLLMTRGLIRVGLDVPPGAEFVIDGIDDPNRCGRGTTDASLFRRPLPTTNLRFLSAVMWDGRESPGTATILEDLLHQANSATRGHAQATLDITEQQARDIVTFETGLFTAQARDESAGSLHARGAAGGPVELARQPFFVGINDPVGLNPTGAAFNQNAFDLFNAWASLKVPRDEDDPVTRARLAVARGQALFNSKAFTISGVAGLNSHTFANGVIVPPAITGTCTTCHDTPNAGDHSVKAPLNIGIADPERASFLPVYTLRNLTTSETVQTTDPGRAMITGKWKDIGKFKGPILRALAARAPYFHNGSADTLEEVVEFYETRFKIQLTVQERADLVAFLRAL